MLPKRIVLNVYLATNFPMIVCDNRSANNLLIDRYLSIDISTSSDLRKLVKN